MFDKVFNDKQWKTARDATGLKGSLTEKVSMGDEFKKFAQNKTVGTARVLLQKVELYEKQLKDKHAKDKYYAKLLKVVQDQKVAIEAGLQEIAEEALKAAATTTQGTPEAKAKTEKEDKEMDKFLDEVVEKQVQHNRSYENTTNDPNAPAFPGEGRRVFLKLKAEFPAVDKKIQTESLALTELLQRCKSVESFPGLATKPDIAIPIAKKIMATLEKIETASTDAHSDFVTEAGTVRKEEGRETAATKELDGMLARLQEDMLAMADRNRACRLSLKKTLQLFESDPQAQEILGKLHV
jgi:hypothetical protein